MEKKFKETSINEDYSKILAKNSITLGPSVTPMIALTLFDGVSRCLGAIKSQTTPKAILFRAMDHSFIAGAKIEYIAGDSDDPTSSRWDYIWTFYEDDLKGADIIDISSNQMVLTYFEASAMNLFKMKFQGAEICSTMMSLLIEMIKKWVVDNTTAAEGAVLTYDGAFKAMGEMENGEVTLGIIPDGAMKVLVKDDAALSN